MKASFCNSRKSLKQYVEWRKIKMAKALNRVQDIRKIKGANILDIGCGYGALSELLLERGGIVSSTEINNDSFKISKERFKNNSKINIFKVEDEMLPFKENEFDIVFLFDVIEHVKNHKKMIEESMRVLKNKGVLYVCFLPYYSITGHHLYDFAKWPIHILPKKYIKKIVYSKKMGGNHSADDYWAVYESLNKMKISYFQKIIEPLSKVKERFVVKYPDLFELNVPFLNFLGPWKDTFTMSFEGIYLNKK